MNATSFALVLAGVLLNAFAQLLLKAGTNRAGHLEFTVNAAWETGIKILSQWPFLLGFAFYGLSLVIWIAALSRVPVTIAYPMLSIGYVVNALIARYWLGEQLTGTGWAGMAFICLGVWLIARHGS
jgi:multidrug transporter EmrE-like cation transporter